MRPERWEVVSRKLKQKADPDGSRYIRKPIGGDRSGQKLNRPSRRSKWWSSRPPFSKKSRLMNTRKRPTRCTSTDDKGQKDLRDATNDEISTKKEGSNGKNINTNVRLYEKREQRIRWIEWQQSFGWKECMCSKWRRK